MKDEYNQDFKTEIRQYFNQLEQNGVQHPILDIRDNQGGDLEYGVYLLAHLIDKPFKMLDGYYKLSHSPDRSLEKAIGESTSVHQPMEHVFRGSLYVLINGGSFSNSGIICACLRREDRADLIKNPRTHL